MIDITLLGTSALVPAPERALTAAALVCGGHTVLFDCGEGTQTAARRARVSLMKTDIIALTHYHGDHIFGIPGLLQTMGSAGRTDTLYITGPEDIEKELEPVIRLAGALPFELKLMHLPDEGIRPAELVHGWHPAARLVPVKTKHRVASVGYSFILDRAGKFMPDKAKELNIPVNMWGILQHGGTVAIDGAEIKPEQVMGEMRKGLKFVFSGDTAECGDLENAAKAADLLICDATYGDNAHEPLAEQYGHMTFAQAARLARNAEVKRLWLAHYSQRIENPEGYIANAQEYFKDVVCAADGMKIKLCFE